MADTKGTGRGMVVETVTLPVRKLNDKSLTLNILEVQTEQGLKRQSSDGTIEHYTAPLLVPEVCLEYPDGYRRYHQASDLPSLIARADNILRNKYGVTGYRVTGSPGDLSVGKIQLEDVAYGS